MQMQTFWLPAVTYITENSFEMAQIVILKHVN